MIRPARLFQRAFQVSSKKYIFAHPRAFPIIQQVHL